MLRSYFTDLAHLFFPKLCVLCHQDLLAEEQHICLSCQTDLPYTNFYKHKKHALDAKFKGRFEYERSNTLLYFNTSGQVHDILHEIKYRNNQELAIHMGRLIGRHLANELDDIDVIIPVPLHKRREVERGYNQSALLAEGLSQIIKKPVVTTLVKRIKDTATQTHKTRAERIENMENAFEWQEVNDQNLLLLDDVITTGSTLESIVNAMPEQKGQLSILSLAAAIAS